MSIRPIDMKTSLLTADDASKMRENQKNQEAGLAEQVAQNRHNQETRTDTVQHTQAAEGQVIRKEDEENPRGRQGNQNKKKSANKYGNKEEEKPKIQDGIHGSLDLKA
ncbi:MAG: hypothetical protein II567_06615 [Candidatus Riflebacteria bacterium]|jgi:hypothetical protein|nr:hypothetical protein [Candidatus Riflebacteria bacterium]